MKPKTIVIIALLLFVAASVVYLVVEETDGKSVAPPPVTSENKTADAKVVAYYFHGNVRCATCRSIESYAREAVQTGFVDALKDGRLEWRVVNVEDSGNDRFVQDFQLSTRSVVLERIADGKRREWKNLQRVWELVRGDKEDFLKYVQDEIRVYLEAAGK